MQDAKGLYFSSLQPNYYKSLTRSSREKDFFGDDADVKERYFEAQMREKKLDPNSENYLPEVGQIYQEFVEKQFPEALFQYGMILKKYGDFLEQFSGVKHIEKAANLGHQQAHYELGNHYKTSGQYALALNWFNSAKKAGHDLAQFIIDEMEQDFTPGSRMGVRLIMAVMLYSRTFILNKEITRCLH